VSDVVSIDPMVRANRDYARAHKRKVEAEQLRKEAQKALDMAIREEEEAFIHTTEMVFKTSDVFSGLPKQE